MMAYETPGMGTIGDHLHVHLNGNVWFESEASANYVLKGPAQAFSKRLGTGFWGLAMHGAAPTHGGKSGDDNFLVLDVCA